MMIRRNFMRYSSVVTILMSVCLLSTLPTTTFAWVVKPSSWTAATQRMSTVSLNMADSAPEPTTFREAEILGLRLMQDGDYQGALDGTLTSTFCQ